MSESSRPPWSLDSAPKQTQIGLDDLARELNVSIRKLQDVLSQLGCAKPERRSVLRSRSAGSGTKSTLFYSIEDANKVRRYFGAEKELSSAENENEKKNEIPEGSISLSALRMKLGLERRELDELLHEITLEKIRTKGISTPFGVLPQSSAHEEIFYSNNRGAIYVPPDVAAKATELSQEIFRVRDRVSYFTAADAIRALGFTGQAQEEKLNETINQALRKYPWLTKEIIEKVSRVGDSPSKYYSKYFISFLQEQYQNEAAGSASIEMVEIIPEGYLSYSEVANQLQLFPSKLDILVKQTLIEHKGLEKPIVGLFHHGRTRSRITHFYSRNFFKAIVKVKEEEDRKRKESGIDNSAEIISFETGEGAPVGYIARKDLALLLNTSQERLDRLVEEARQLHPEMVSPIAFVFKKNSTQRPNIFYSPELVKVVCELKKDKDQEILGKFNTPDDLEKESVPEGHISRAVCALDLGISGRKLAQLVEKCVSLDPALSTEELKIPNRKRSLDFSVYYSPKLIAAIVAQKQKDEEHRLYLIEQERQRIEKVLMLQEKLALVLSKIEQGNAEMNQFRELVSLFGGARIIDILYRLYPEFKELSDEHVKKEVASYLTDYMVSRPENVIGGLGKTTPYLAEQVFRDSLFGLIKNDMITVYGKEKRHQKEKPDKEILEGYIALLKKETSSMHSRDLADLVVKMEEYVISLLNDFQKPEAIIDELGPNRSFPDLNQIINIKEIGEQRRLLIGDEMGMGKSGSAILAKEYLGLGPAIVVVPANAVDVWKEYLSDEVSHTGKQLGYFKKGNSPKVMEVQDIKDVSLMKTRGFDYVIISHDRMTEECAEELRKVDYEMVIIDEAHKFKNITEGKRAKALLNFLEDCEEEETYTVLLSGTPIPNKIKDIAIILKILYPEKFGQIDNNLLVTSIIKGDLVDLRELLLKRTQMKKLSESVEMPQKTEFNNYVDLNKDERELYQLIMDNEQLSAMEKISALRLFCLNPQKVFPDKNMKGSKIVQVEEDVANFFTTHSKLVLFVNGYVSGVIRGESSLLTQMNIPDGVTVKIIDGDVSREERREIEQDLKYATGKILLVVNGSAVDVAVDFSSADGVRFYNEPWTKFDKMQQTSRVYRPGLKEEIGVGTSITKGTIEEGMHYYLEMKYRAVVKLLEGVPLSEIEKSLLLLDEKISDMGAIDKDQGLAEEWLQTPVGRLDRFSKTTREIGEREFKSGFLEQHGGEYAASYEELETRSFQANTARVVSAIIDEYRHTKGLSEDIIVLDLASGPEMLRKRMREAGNENVYSLDINGEHFKEWNGRQITGGFTKLDFFDSSVDYVNMSLALHYSSFDPAKKEYERLTVLSEIARVLKVGGRATINLTHTQRFKSIDILRNLLDEMGLQIVDSVTGLVTSESHYVSQCVTFEKVEEIDIPTTLQELKTRRMPLLYGLRLDTTVKTKKLQGSQDVAKNFVLNGRTISTELNEEDKKLLIEQEYIRDEGLLLIRQYGSVSRIPQEEILKRGYVRYVSGKRNYLAKKGEYSQKFIYV